REYLTTCYQVEATGTTGAGDCTIAGFLMGILRGARPHEALQGAVAVGACNVERTDATSGVPPWSDVERRMEGGWQRHQQQLRLVAWAWDELHQVWRGPRDAQHKQA